MSDKTIDAEFEAMLAEGIADGKITGREDDQKRLVIRLVREISKVLDGENMSNGTQALVWATGIVLKSLFPEEAREVLAMGCASHLALVIKGD